MEVPVEQVILKNIGKVPKKKLGIKNQECQQNFLKVILEAGINKSRFPAIWGM
jgi:hypothetical protein